MSDFAVFLNSVNLDFDMIRHCGRNRQTGLLEYLGLVAYCSAPLPLK